MENNDKNRFSLIKKLSWFDKIFVFLFVILFFPSLYVGATMNAVGDRYFPGLDDFKDPFYMIKGFILEFLILAILVSVLIPKLRKKELPLFKALGLFTIIISFIVWGLGFAPCMYEYEQPQTLQKVVRKSLMCPEYSIPSSIAVIMYIVVGGLTVLSANAWKGKSK